MESLMKEKHLIVSQALAGVQDKLYAMIYVLLAGSFDTMDVLQDTNVAILKHADLYDESRPALPWFKAFAMNQVLHYRRSRRDEKLLFDTDLINELAAILSEHETATESGAVDYLALLEKCLEKLPPWQRDLMRERYQDGNKVNEMAATRLMSRVSLSVLMFRIRKTLQACVEKSLKKDGPGLEEKTVESRFACGLDAVLDGTATQEEQDEWLAQMRNNSDLKRVYVSQVRMHALMRCRHKRLFPEVPAASRKPSVVFPFGSRVSAKYRYVAAAAIFAVLLLGGLWMWQPSDYFESGSKHAILVGVCDMDEEEWLSQLTPLDLQAYEENMGFHNFHRSEPEMIKYEPGIIPNPGASIEILAIEGDTVQGRHLVKGDKVWREHLDLAVRGSMKFKLETGATLTLIGPASLDLADKRTVSLINGAVMVECADQPITLKLPGAEVYNCRAVFCVDAFSKKRYDVLTLSGVIKVVYAESSSISFLRAGDGIRLAKDAQPTRFRCLASNQDVKEKFLSGNAKIVMGKRK